MSPVQVDRSNNDEKKFWHKIKSPVFSISTPKVKLQENSPQKLKALSAMTQSQGSAVSRLFMPRQVTEAQDLMTSVEWVPEEKLGIHHSCAPSKKFIQRTTPSSRE